MYVPETGDGIYKMNWNPPKLDLKLRENIQLLLAWSLLSSLGQPYNQYEYWSTLVLA